MGETTRFYPFGGYRTGDGHDMMDQGFTGHKHHDEIGLIYMYARYYVPNTNRMLTPDTIVPDPTNPQSFNRYSYVLNSPLRFTDPSGHRPSNGCEYEGCTLPDFLDPDSTWVNSEGTYSLYDPALLELYPAEITAELVLFTAAGLFGAAAAPIAIEYVVAEVAWPAVVKAGSTIASWLCLADGDCTNEAQGAANVAQRTTDFLADKANTVNHILQPKHAWNRLTTLSGNSAQDYQALQPYLQQAVDNGTRTLLSGGPNVTAVQYVYTIQGETVVVRGIELANNVFQISDAWVRIIP